MVRAVPIDMSLRGCTTVTRNLPFSNWWWDPFALRNVQPSALSRLMTLRLSVSNLMHTYMRPPLLEVKP